MTSYGERFSELVRNASECKLCTRMKDFKAVLSSANGFLGANIVFVAEAPGRLGADRTRVPFQGDRSGKNFEILLTSIGLSRREVFITNSVLCLPLKDGKNSPPTLVEVENCSKFLKSTLDLIKPRLVVSLGVVALNSLNRIFQTKYKLSESAAHPQKLPNFILIPLYHPSPRVIYTRRTMTQQKRDFKKIALWLKKSDNRKSRNIRKHSPWNEIDKEY